MAEKFTDRFGSRIMRLSCLSPDVLERPVILLAVRDKLLTPERLSTILETLIDRKAAAKDVSVGSRRAALEAEIRDLGDKLARLYRAIEDGVVEIDSQLKDRIAEVDGLIEGQAVEDDASAENETHMQTLNPS